LPKKTTIARILFGELRANKRVLLETEYTSYQRYIKGDKKVELYPAMRQDSSGQVPFEAQEIRRNNRP
jgi:hypothetical protein